MYVFKNAMTAARAHLFAPFFPMRVLILSLLLCDIAACEQVWAPFIVTPEDLDMTTRPDSPPLRECTRQRAVNIVAGNYGLAWFTLIWPLPAVIVNFSTDYAYDDPAKAGLVRTDPAHPLYARQVSGMPLWDRFGGSKRVSAVLAGQTRLGEVAPTGPGNSNSLPLGVGGPVQLFAAEAALESFLLGPIPVVSFLFNSDNGTHISMPYGPANGAPSALEIVDVTDMIGQLSSRFPNRPRLAADLTLDADKLKSWYSGDQAAPGFGMAAAGHRQRIPDRVGCASHSPGL